MRLINKAYEIEHYIIDADRTDKKTIEERLKKGKFILIEHEETIIACIYAEPRAERCFFGMLAVHPDYQGQKLGYKLIAEAENYAKEMGCRNMDIQILSVRQELPPFYHAAGYTENGTSALPSQLELKLPCHFIHMTKAI